MDETYLCDLDTCEPRGAVAVDAAPGRWQAMHYEAEGLSGSMLVACDETGAPEITYRLNKDGWHRLSVGLCPAYDESVVQMRLTNDIACAMFRFDPSTYGDRAGHGEEVIEMPWKVADVTGQDILISQICVDVTGDGAGGPQSCRKAVVAYIRAVPLTAEEVAEVRAERERRDTKRLHAHNDAHGYIHLMRASTKEEVWRELEPYRNSDFSRIYWEAGMGDLRFYLGKHGRSCCCDSTRDFYRQGDRWHAEGWRRFRDSGVDPLVVARDRAREIGLEFHAAYRTAGFYYPPPIDQWNTDGLYEQRPDLRSTKKDGSPAPRLSYTFPEVRQNAIALLQEVAEIGVDGVCLLYNRRPPLIDYDAPLVEAFESEHGVDPRTLPDDDERWLDIKSGPLNEFMRELRTALGPDMHISACVSNRRENRLYGMDIQTWISEGLVDTLIPYTSATELLSSAESWPNMVEVDHFVELTKGTSCALSMSILPRHMSPEAYRSKAAGLYDKGVENLFFWDSAGGFGRADYSPSWQEICRLGHRSEIGKWHATGATPFSPEPRRITRLGDYDMSYQTPG